MFFNLFKIQSECIHEKISPDMEAGYCPDCGEYVENHWFITRCTCCGVKQKTIVLKDEISAATKFCKNCGNSSFIVQQVKKINFIDINYAILLKNVVKNKIPYFVQSWVEPHDYRRVKLIASGYKNSQ